MNTILEMTLVWLGAAVITACLFAGWVTLLALSTPHWEKNASQLEVTAMHCLHGRSK